MCVYAFDLLFLNGESLVREPFRKRLELLQSSFQEVEGEFMFAKSIVSADTDIVAEFLEESIRGLFFSMLSFLVHCYLFSFIVIFSLSLNIIFSLSFSFLFHCYLLSAGK